MSRLSRCSLAGARRVGLVLLAVAVVFVLTLGVATQARAAKSRVAAIDVKDPYTKSKSLTKALRRAGASVNDVTRRLLGGKLRLDRFDAVVVGSFATSDAELVMAIEAASETLAAFVEGGGTLVFLAQEARDTKTLPGLPEGMYAELGERDGTSFVFEESSSNSLSFNKKVDPEILGRAGMKVGRGDKTLQVRGVHDAYAELRGFEVQAWLSEGPVAVLAQGSFGKGRVVVCALPLDEYVQFPEEKGSGGAALQLLRNILAFSSDVRKGRAVPARPVERWRATLGERKLVVFDDADGDGVLAEGETRISGVRVGHGFARHVTDDKGEVLLETDAASPRWVHVQSPSAWEFPQGIFARDDRPAELFFAARRRAEVPSAFSILHVTDVHVGSRRFSEERYRQLVEGWGRLADEVAFVLSTGDMTQTGSESEIAEYVELTSASTLPVYDVMGNHDAGRGPDRGRYFEERVGPVFYGFDHGGVHFTVAYAVGPHSPEMDWIKKDIVESKLPTVLVLHHLPGAALLEALRGLPVVGVMHGHWHGNRVSWFDDYPVIATSTAVFGGWDYSPASVRTIAFEDGKIVGSGLRYTAADQMAHIAVPADGSEDDASLVVVHALDTWREATQVHCSLTGVEGGAVAELDLVRKSPTAWSAALPAMEPGQYMLHADIKDEHGTISTALSTFTVPEHTVAAGEPRGRWSTYRGDQRRTGVRRAELRGKRRLRWARPLPGNCHHAPPVADGERLYVAIEDREGVGSISEPGVYALDRATGALLWKWRSASSVRHSPALYRAGKAEALVIIQEESGTVTALRADDGQVAWQYDLAARHPTRYAGHWASCAPLVDGKQLIACYHSRPVVLSAARGTLVGELEKQGREDAFTLSSAARGEGILVHGGLGSGLTGYEPNGRGGYRKLWEKKARRLATTPTFTRGAVVVQATGGIQVLDPRTGDTIESIDVKGAWSPHSPTVVGKRVVVTDRTGSLLSLRLADGKRQWKVRTQAAPLCQAADGMPGTPNLSGSPVVRGSTMFFGADDGFLRAVSTKSGKLLWERDMGVPVTGGPIPVGDDLYVVDFGGVVYAFR